jgi:hypothetical protein
MNWMHISEQVLNLSIDYLTDASYEWYRERISLPDDIQHRLTELYKALGDVLTVEPKKTEPMIELHLTEEEWYYIRSRIELFSTITDNPTVGMRVQDKLCLAFDEYYKRKNMR